jgi:hypothetical protein
MTATAHLIHDDGGTSVRIYVSSVQVDQYYVNAESGIDPRGLLPPRCRVAVERYK